MSRGSAASEHRVQVLEVEPSRGSLDSAGQARVTVERFGAERQNEFDVRKLRRRVRDPHPPGVAAAPIFVGQAQDLRMPRRRVLRGDRSTVFQPRARRVRRDHFDEVIIALGFLDYRMRSKDLAIDDAAVELEGISVAISTNQVDMATSFPSRRYGSHRRQDFRTAAAAAGRDAHDRQ